MIVVDTNVMAYLWLPSDLSRAAEALLEEDADWVAPLLWRSEFRSILTGAVHSGRLSLSRATEIAAAAEAQLRGREFGVDSGQVLSLAQASDCSAYDCEFVALAKDTSTKLVTNDQQVLRAFPETAMPLRRSGL